VEGDAVDGMTVAVQVFLDLDAVWIIGTHFMQGHQMRYHQTCQRQRHRNHVQREEAVQRRIGDVVIAADQLHQPVTDHGHGTEQRGDHLRAPERHLSPRQ